MTAAATDRKGKAIEVVKSRLEELQGRIGDLEVEARGRVARALTSGNVKLRELDEALSRASRKLEGRIADLAKRIEGARRAGEQGKATTSGNGKAKVAGER